MKFKFFFAGVLSLLLFISSAPSIYAESGIKTQVGYSLHNWKLDEENGYIYTMASGYMQNPSRLLFLDQHDLTVKADIPVEGGELEYADGKVYVQGNGSPTITVVDVSSKSVEKTLATQKKPAHIKLDGHKLFYVDNTYSQYHTIPKLYVIDLTDDSEKAISLSSDANFSWVDIDLDNQNHILYMAEIYNTSRHEQARIQAISTDDYRILDQYVNLDGQFFKQAENIIAEGSDVFYAGYRFDANNLKIRYGSYGDKKIRYVKGDFVFADTAVFDRETFKKIKDLDRPLDLLDRENNAYYKRQVDMGATDLEKSPFFVDNRQTIHIVEPGETLWTISRQYGTTVSAIAGINGLDEEKYLPVGQALKIPALEETYQPPAGLDNLPFYTAKPGDSYWKIAKQFKLTVEELTVPNHLDPDKTLFVGQTIRVPAYKVKQGDTVWNIANGFDMTADELVQLNGLKDPNLIIAGEWLKVKVMLP